MPPVFSGTDKILLMQQNSFPGIEHNKEERLTPRELYQKHLRDPHHHVSDEELRNLKVGVEAQEEIDVEKELIDKRNKINGIPNKSVLPNPYEVLK